MRQILSPSKLDNFSEYVTEKTSSSERHPASGTRTFSASPSKLTACVRSATAGPHTSGHASTAASSIGSPARIVPESLCRSRRADCIPTASHHKILRTGMVHHHRRSGLLRFNLERVGQRDPDLLRMQNREQLGLVLEIRTRRIPKRVARAAVFLMEQISDPRRILRADSKLLANLAVHVLGERLSSFHAEPV